MPGLTKDDVLDMDYDQIGRLREAAARWRYILMSEVSAVGAFFGIGLSFKAIRAIPTWEELVERGRRQEMLMRSVFVQKGRESLRGSEEPGTPDTGTRPE